MKKWAIFLLSIAVLSCDNSSQTSSDTKVNEEKSTWRVKSDSLHEVTMEVHDEAMLLMDPIVELLDSIQNRSDLDSTLTSERTAALEEAEKAMMDWMHQGQGLDTLKGERRWKALEKRWVEMDALHAKMKSSIESAEELLANE